MSMIQGKLFVLFCLTISTTSKTVKKLDSLEVLVTQLCLTVCDPMGCSPPGSTVHGILQCKTTGLGHHFLLQVTFLTQGLKLGLLYCRQILYHLSLLNIYAKVILA